MNIKDYAYTVVAMVWAFVAPVHTLIIATGALVMFDMITGIAKALKTKQKITSNRMRHTITKGLAYQIAILTGFFLDNAMGLDMMASRVIAGVVCVVEAKSVLENVESMTGISIWSAVLDRLKPPQTPETTKKKDSDSDI